MHGFRHISLRGGQTSSVSLNINIILSNELLRVENLTQLLDPNFLVNLQKKEENFQISKQEKDSRIFVDLNSHQEISPKKRELGFEEFFGFTGQKETPPDAIKNLSDVPSKGFTTTKESSDTKILPIDFSLSEGNHHFSQRPDLFHQLSSNSLKTSLTSRALRRRLRRKLRRISFLIAQAWREDKSPKIPSILKKVKLRPEFSHLEVTRSLFGKNQCGKRIKRF